jgi:hypothetical protein
MANAPTIYRHQESEDVELVTVKAIVIHSLFDVITGHVKKLYEVDPDRETAGAAS